MENVTHLHSVKSPEKLIAEFAAKIADCEKICNDIIDELTVLYKKRETESYVGTDRVALLSGLLSEFLARALRPCQRYLQDIRNNIAKPDKVAENIYALNTWLAEAEKDGFRIRPPQRDGTGPHAS